MKRVKTSVITVLVFALMITSIPFASFAGSMTLEKYLKKDPKAMSQLKKEAKASGVKIKFKGNTVTYSYDLKGKLSKKKAFSAKTRKALTKELKKNKKLFKGICKDIRKQTGIRKTKVVVKYTYKGKKVVSMTFKE